MHDELAGKSESASPLMSTYGGYTTTIVSGDGCVLVDDHGRRYLDFLGGISVVSLGHANNAIASALAEQAQTLVHVSNFFANPKALKLAEEIDLLLGGGGKVFFSNSGAEANEAAIKLARRYGARERFEIVSAVNGFHGRTLGALAATGQPAKQDPFRPLPEGFLHVPFNDLDAMREALDRPTVVAVLLEPIQAEAGIIDPLPGYLEAVAEMARDRSVLFIIDEVQTGLCRTGRWFGFEHFGLSPDIVTMAKALGNGVPIGATWAKSSVAQAFQPGDHGTTFGGGALASAAALAVLGEMKRLDLAERTASMGEYLRSALRLLPGVRALSGRGLLVGVELSEPRAQEVAKRALEAGLIVNALSADRLRLAPPLIVSTEEIDAAVTILRSVLT
jgi:predicted acetylornithine/succinylornithine family transaminase